MSFAFAGMGMCGTCYMRSWQDFDLISLAIVPLFLFSGVFYPLSVYPEWLRLLVTVHTPLPRRRPATRLRYRCRRSRSRAARRLPGSSRPDRSPGRIAPPGAATARLNAPCGRRPLAELAGRAGGKAARVRAQSWSGAGNGLEVRLPSRRNSSQALTRLKQKPTNVIGSNNHGHERPGTLSDPRQETTHGTSAGRRRPRFHR